MWKENRLRHSRCGVFSSRPEEDTLSENMSSVGGKAGDNWRDAVDRNGNRYYLFELNPDHLPDHQTNPYQVWALPLTEGDRRGLLRVVPHPKATVTEYVTSQTGMTKQPSAKWWDFCRRFPLVGRQCHPASRRRYLSPYELSGHAQQLCRRQHG